MKKILSIILAMIMTFTLAVPVMGAEPEPQTYRAVYLGGNEFFIEDTYRLEGVTSPNPTTVTTYEISPAAGNLKAGEIYDITVTNGVVSVAIAAEASGHGRITRIQGLVGDIQQARYLITIWDEDDAREFSFVVENEYLNRPEQPFTKVLGVNRTTDGSGAIVQGLSPFAHREDYTIGDTVKVFYRPSVSVAAAMYVGDFERSPKNYRAVYLGGNEFFNETTYTATSAIFFPPTATTVKTYEIAQTAGSLKTGEIYDITVDSGVVVAAKESKASVHGTITNIEPMVPLASGYWAYLDNETERYPVRGRSPTVPASTKIIKVNRAADGANTQALRINTDVAVGDKVKIFRPDDDPDATVEAMYVFDEDLNITATKNAVYGESFTLNTAFDKETASNAAILSYTWDADLFKYEDFTPAEGVTVLDTQLSDGFAKITVMIDDYKANVLGNLVLSVKAEDTNSNLISTVNLAVEYVVKDGDNKFVKTRIASADVLVSPPSFTLIDLSNIIDWFGIKTGEPEWEKARLWDFNKNGEIDIFDIAYVAQRINSLITKAPETQTYRAVYLGGNEFFNESTYPGPAAPITITTYQIAPAAGTLEPGEVYDITVGNGVVLEAKLSQVAVRPRTPPTPLEGTIVSFSVSFVGMQFSLQLDTPVGTIGYIWGVSRHPGVKKGMFRITQMGDNATVEAVFEDVFDLTRGMWCGLNAGDYVKMYGTPAEQEYGPATHVDSIYIIDFDEEIKITATQNAV